MLYTLVSGKRTTRRIRTVFEDYLEEVRYEEMARIDCKDGMDNYDYGQDFTDEHDIGDGSVEIENYIIIEEDNDVPF